MGMKRDMRQQVTLAQVDDDAKKHKVEVILKEESLVPAFVSSTLFAG
jgi:hypothetical protein